MLDVRRVGAIAAMLALIGICTSAHVWGEPGPDKGSKDSGDGPSHPAPQTGGRGDPRFTEKIGTSRFTNHPFLSYETVKGENLFALQVTPKLEPLPARPRDILVLVDTSASKAQGPLVMAIKLTELLAEQLGADDRMAVWTVNTEPRDLTKGWKSRGQLADAVKELNRDYPSGAVNLKKGVDAAVKSFDAIAGRQRLVLFFGDGKSLAGPLDNDGRADLCAKMVQQKIAFFAVPLSANVDYQNLHSLVGGTGGKVVRMEEAGSREALVKRFFEVAAVPVLYPESIKLPAEVTEAMPTKLPPLRADTATLVAGKLSKPVAKFEYTVSGTVAGGAKSVTDSPRVEAANPDNFFLVQLINQWRDAKDQPALLQADRALVFAHSDNVNALNNLLADAQWAMDENKFDSAAKLFGKALNLDPRSTEAKSALDVVQQLRDGKLTRDEIKKRFEPKPGDKSDKVIRLVKNEAPKEVSREQVLKEDQQPEPAAPPKPPEPLAPPAAPQDALKDFRARQAVNNQAATRIVEDAINRANRLVKTQPDAAHDFLKQALDGIRSNPDISPDTQIDLIQRLAGSLQSVDREGVVVKRTQEDILQALSVADARRQSIARTEVRDAEIRERLRVFHKLMNEARDEEAFDVAKTIRQDLIDRGDEIPQAVTAAYVSGLRSYNLKELNRLKLVREEKWLAVILNVEESFIPFPDEPPVEFPSPAVVRRLTKGRFSNWSDWSLYRIKKYDATSLGSNIPEKAFLLRQRLNLVIPSYGSNSRTSPQGPGDTLKDHLEWITDHYSGDRGDGVNVQISFDVYDRAFEAAGIPSKGLGIRSTDFSTTDWVLHDVTLATVLKKLLSQIVVSPGEATYIIRRDQIELTTSTLAALEKTIRVYPVADLVIPLGMNPFFGPGAGLGGVGGVGGGIGGIGGIGGQIGGFGGQIGGGLGGFGGQIGGGLGGFGGQIGGGLGGFGGQIGGGLGGLGGGLGGFGGGLGGLGGGLGGLGGGLGGLGGGLGGLGGGLGGLGGGLGGLGGGLGGLGGGLGGLGGGLGGFGGGLGGLGGGLGGLGGGLGGFGGGLGGLGGGLGGFGGGLGGLGGGLGGFGGGLGGLGGGIGAISGGLGGIGGIGGSLGGIGGGNLGQGQYLQTLIRQVVGKPSEWRAAYDPFTGQPLLQIDPTTGLPVAPPPGDVLTGQNNNIAFYPPAQALIVTAPSRITGNFRPPYPSGPGGAGPALNIGRANDDRRDVAFVPADKARVLGDHGKRPDNLDPKVVWQDALVKAQAGDPSVIIAIADFLGLQGKWEDCAEFLKAELRLGIVVKPWVYETLAIALRESGGSTEEIERAEISVVDLQPGNAAAFLRASAAMAEHKHYDRALAFCRQASILEPNTAAPYSEALLYAEYSGDAKGMEWAAGGLLKQDWPVQNKELQLKARQKLDSLAKSLAEKNQTAEAKQLRGAVEKQRRRDLVVKASFQGEANVDLKVKEPTGGVCWSLNRQTIGGGTYSGDTVGDLNNQSYTVATAFSGDYEVTVERVWGHPLGDKVQVRIIRHQGTDDEAEQLVTVDLKDAKRPPVKFKLENGRRTETAYVPPPALQAVPTPVADPVAAANVMDQLRDLANPELFGSNAGFRCNAGSPVPYDVLPSANNSSVKAAPPSPDDRVLYQNKVASFMKQSLDVTAQSVLASDRRTVRLSLTPQFTPATGGGAAPVVTSSVIPGGGGKEP